MKMKNPRERPSPSEIPLFPQELDDDGAECARLLLDAARSR
jgi:hypothetical protein